jgi:uncharacterized membrane protein YfcA
MLPALVTAAGAHLAQGTCLVRWLPALCMGTVVGGAAGASAALQTSQETLQTVLGAALTLAGLISTRSVIGKLRIRRNKWNEKC